MTKLCVVILFLFNAALASAADKVTYYHNDALGSPVAATDDTGKVIWREEYEAYGKRLIQDAKSQDNTLWYTGKQEEAEFGLQYFQARWYDPSVGVFLSRDQAGFVVNNLHSFNKYTYVNNNPYGFVDPDGHYGFSIHRVNVEREFLKRNGSAYNQGVSLVLDFVPIVGDAKGIMDVYIDPTPVAVAAATIGLVPFIGDGAAKALKFTKGTSKADLLRQGTDVRAKDVKEAREILDSMPELRPGPGNVSPGMRDRRNSFRGDLINTKDPKSSKIHDRGKHADQPHFNIDIRDKNGVRHKPAIFIDD